MKSPLTKATLLATSSAIALVGMLLTSGVWDVLFLGVALLPLGWGVASFASKAR